MYNLGYSRLVIKLNLLDLTCRLIIGAYCLTTWVAEKHGLKSEYIATYLSAETTSYYTFQPCPLVKGDFLSFVRFELFMCILFAAAFYYVQKRKKRQLQLQQWRIAGY